MHIHASYITYYYHFDTTLILLTLQQTVTNSGNGQGARIENLLYYTLYKIYELKEWTKYI